MTWLTAVVGGIVGGVVSGVFWLRVIVGYWPWQGEDAQRRAGW